MFHSATGSGGIVEEGDFARSRRKGGKLARVLKDRFVPV